jgi:hypothetical protein
MNEATGLPAHKTPPVATSPWQRAAILVIALVVLSLAWFLKFAWWNVVRGPSSADDAWIALSAKHLAMGQGYATWLSNSMSVPFDPNISTGPVGVLAAALIIRIFGATPWAPGASQLMVFCLLFAALLFVLARQRGLGAATLALAYFLVLLIFASARNWYFGALLGEPLALGFLLLGFAMLAERPAIWSTAAVGAAMSLAFLSKEISLFPIGGAVATFFLLNVFEKKTMRRSVSPDIMLIVSLLVLPLAFEAVRLFALGISQYLVEWRSVVGEATPGLASGGSLGYRLGKLVQLLVQDYISWFGLLSLFALPVAALVEMKTNDGPAYQFVRRYFAIGFGACAALFIYLLLYSSLWSRYLWIGVGVLFSIPAVSILCIGGWRRNAIALLGLYGAISLWYNPSMQQMMGLLRDRSVAEERVAVTTLIRQRRPLPLGAESWASIDDIVYGLGQREGKWAAGQTLDALRGKPFLGVINETFTNMKSNFAIRVLERCTTLTPANRHIKLYVCGRHYWSAH